MERPEKESALVAFKISYGMKGNERHQVMALIYNTLCSFSFLISYKGARYDADANKAHYNQQSSDTLDFHGIDPLQSFRLATILGLI